MGLLFHLFFGGLQLANAVIFSAALMGWLCIYPSSITDFVSAGFAIAVSFLLFYLLPSLAIVAGGIIFYYAVWVCQLSPIMAIFLALPAIVISLIAIWMPVYDTVIADPLTYLFRRFRH